MLLRRVTGKSMLPALKPGQLVIGMRLQKQLRPGEVVIFTHQGLEKIKRIRSIKDGRLFLTGDNEAASTDSRSFGWVTASAVRAKVIWPRVAVRL